MIKNCDNCKHANSCELLQGSACTQWEPQLKICSYNRFNYQECPVCEKAHTNSRKWCEHERWLQGTGEGEVFECLYQEPEDVEVELKIKVKVPNQYKWVAVDDDGCYAFKTKPSINTTLFRAEDGADARLLDIINWRETLTEVER